MIINLTSSKLGEKNRLAKRKSLSSKKLSFLRRVTMKSARQKAIVTKKNTFLSSLIEYGPRKLNKTNFQPYLSLVSLWARIV